LEGSHAVVLIALPVAPKTVKVSGTALTADEFEFKDGVLRIRFANSATGVDVEVAR
jgi:hypothetical protein